MKKSSSNLLQFQSGVTLVGGGGFPRDLLIKSISLAPNIIAADGGANFLLKTKNIPKYIIGDLDSIIHKEEWISRGSKIFKINEQETTDFDKCISLIDAKKIIGIGFADQRLDHFLAVCSSLVKHKRIILIIGRRDLILNLPNNFSINLPLNSRVSLFPMTKISTLKKYW